MEDVSKDQLKDLQNFFKQRNKQNEGINSQVIDHIGKLLSEIDGSKLNEVDKIQNKLKLKVNNANAVYLHNKYILFVTPPLNCVKLIFL